MKFDTRDTALTAVFAALYVIINVLQMISAGNPTVYGPIQLRIADCLIALSALLGWPIVAGVTVGCLLTNAYYFIGVQDVMFGPVANLIAASIIFLLRRHRFTACLVGALPVGFIVGGYLWLFFPPPEVLSTLPAWAAMIVSITLSSLVAIAIIGYLLLSILSRPSIMGPLKSRGLKVIAEGE
ncbi:MAG: QueT transporter family protein [Candidatus Bathycorpusculaceae bacterium]